ncbi:MAG: ABC transporter substrate-binding protein [Oscillospiraceae bacterium]|nr:ABC transporter substrate-binding protein [Oscillospiraceae bacterium]
MRKTKAIFLALSLVLAIVLAACGGGSQAPAPADSGGTTSSGTTSSGGTTTTAPADDGGDVPTLIWFMGDPGTIPPDQARVEEVLNEISVREAGVKMQTVFFDNEGVRLALTAGEPWDISFTCEWYNDFAQQAIAGYFADITDLLPTHAPGLWDSMPAVVWEGARIGGRILGIPVKKDYAAEIFWRFDKEFFDDIGMPAPLGTRMTFFDIEPYLAAAKAAIDAGNPLAKNTTPLVMARGGIGGLLGNHDMINQDAMIGIPYSAVGTANENTITFVLENTDVTDRLDALHRWFNAGYINQDALTTEVAPQLWSVSSGQGFYGADAIWTGATGFVNEIVQYSGPYLSTASIRGAMNAINVNSQYIEEAVRYQELVNMNQEYRDILRYGIEGVHWDRTSTGLVQRNDAGRNGYQPWPFSQGSYSLSSVEAAEGVEVDPNMWNVIFEGYADIVATNTIGFSFDVTNVQSEIAAVLAVKEKYWRGLATGTLSPADTVPQYISEAESAGIRRIVEEAQSQFDAFLAGR